MPKTKKNRKESRKKDEQKAIKLKDLLTLLKRCQRLGCCPMKKEEKTSSKKKEKIDKNLDRILGPTDFSKFDRLQKGDRLIVKPDNYKNLSVINRGEPFSIFSLPEGYYNIALNAIEKLINSDDISEKDSLIYPILFNFRQYLELIMKDSLRNYKLASRKIKESELGYESTHKLKEIWDELKDYIEKNKEGEEQTEAFEALITEFDEMDQGSFNFRYLYQASRLTAGLKKLNFTNEIDVSLENLERVMKKMHCYIEGINGLSISKLDNSKTIN